jgi:hypothetical protein
MAAYEENTKVTTGAMATFEEPRELLGRHDIHHNRGGGLLGLIPTVASGLLGIGSRHEDDRHHDRHHDRRGGDRPWHGPSTSESSARWESSGGRQGGPPAPAPGRMTGVSMDPLLAPGVNSGRNQERGSRNGSSAGGGSGSGSGSGAGNSPAPGARTGGGVLPPAELQQAAAASQAAATAHHPGAGAPIAPAGGPVGGTQDKMAMRRFGMDAIGSSQWFGDTDEPVVGQSPKRRFDLRGTAEQDEQQTILDDEHQVPPTVIGEGGR